MSSPPPRLTRAPSTFRATHQRFVVRAGTRHYALQYSQIYSRRIAELRPVAMHAARLRWPERDGERRRRATLAPRTHGRRRARPHLARRARGPLRRPARAYPTAPSPRYFPRSLVPAGSPRQCSKILELRAQSQGGAAQWVVAGCECRALFALDSCAAPMRSARGTSLLFPTQHPPYYSPTPTPHPPHPCTRQA